MPHKDPEVRREYTRRYRREVQGRVPIGSTEFRQKVSAAITEHWKTRERRDQTGELNPTWKGDEVTSNGVHSWLRRNYPKAGKCDLCYRIGKTDYAFLRHPASHTRDLADYAELCRSCHIKFDRGLL